MVNAHNPDGNLLIIHALSPIGPTFSVENMGVLVRVLALPPDGTHAARNHFGEWGLDGRASLPAFGNQISLRRGGKTPDNLKRVFEPMFTTKASGMGMGLAICRSIVEGHHGRIWASAGAERGLKFEFAIPTTNDRNELRRAS